MTTRDCKVVASKTDSDYFNRVLLMLSKLPSGATPPGIATFVPWLWPVLTSQSHPL